MPGSSCVCSQNSVTLISFIHHILFELFSHKLFNSCLQSPLSQDFKMCPHTDLQDVNFLGNDTF